MLEDGLSLSLWVLNTIARREVYVLNSSDRPDARQIMDIARGHVKPRVPLADVIKSKRPPEQPQATAKIPENVIKLVMLVIVAAFKPVTEYYQLLRFTRRKGDEAKNAALKLKLLVSHEWHSGQRGGKTVLLEPTKAAFEMFNLTPIYEGPRFMHRFLQENVRLEGTARGYTVHLEKSINRKRLDAVLERHGRMIFVECATTNKHECTNIRKDLRAGVDRIVIIGLDKKIVASVKKKIGKEFSKDILTHVRVCTFAEFISELTT